MKESKTINELAQDLQAQIKEGRYGTGGRIPRVSELAKDWGVSRTTVYSVLTFLQSDGVLYAKDRSFYVTPPSLALEGITENFERFLRDRGFLPEIENLSEPELVHMPKDIANLFGQEEGILVVHRTRLQGVNGLPLRIAENWYPAPLAAQFLDQMRADDHMDVIGAIKKIHGVYITNVQDEVVARLPSADEVKWLRLVRTEPVLEIRRINRSDSGLSIMFNRIIHRASSFKFTYTYQSGHWSK